MRICTSFAPVLSNTGRCLTGMAGLASEVVQSLAQYRRSHPDTRTASSNAWSPALTPMGSTPR